jgi:hypothetical protein
MLRTPVHTVLKRLLPSLILCAFAILGAAALHAEELRQIARYPIQGVFRHIKGFDIDRNGNLLVVDSEAPAMVRIDANGKRIESYSQPGKKYCEISGPAAVVATMNGFVLFDWNRQHLLRFGRDGECQSDDLLRTFQADVLAMSGGRIVGGGSLMKLIPGERCVFFSTDLEASASSATCLLNIKDDTLWLLYGREFVGTSKTTAYYMTPYEPVLYISNGTAVAKAVSLHGLGVAGAAVPADEREIRRDRAKFFDFYNRQTVIEGVAATRAGVVVATRTPGKEHQVNLRYFKDGSGTASANTSLTIAPVTGGYPLHLRGDGDDRVVLLIAKGKHPALSYEAVVYQIR